MAESATGPKDKDWINPLIDENKAELTDESSKFEDDGGVDNNPEDDPPTFSEFSLNSDSNLISDLIRNGSTEEGLKAARIEAAKRLSIYPTRGCAAHLSALLRQSGIMVPFTSGAGRLADELKQRGWTPISVGQQKAGDVGVTRDDDKRIPGPDHVYLVVQVLGEDLMIIADNQRSTDNPHRRFASGRGKTPTDYFLRAA